MERFSAGGGQANFCFGSLKEGGWVGVISPPLKPSRANAKKEPTPSPEPAPFALSRKFLNLLLVKEGDVLEPSFNDFSRLFVLLLNDDEGPDGFLALADDIAPREPCLEGKAILSRVITLGLIGSPAFRDLTANEVRRFL